ncbi:HPr family phosphocarrier protein [bacterium]|nr:HPr family phosphocarrier protein [bacterium]
MIERHLIIQNRLGLHARPAALFVQLAANYDSEIFLIKDDFEVNGKSILSVLMLAAERGSEIVIKADGPDESDAIDKLGGFLEGKMDEFQETTT